jgi:hypothetical protein
MGDEEADGSCGWLARWRLLGGWLAFLRCGCGWLK